MPPRLRAAVVGDLGGQVGEPSAVALMVEPAHPPALVPVGIGELVDQQEREHFGVAEAGRRAAGRADAAGAVALEPAVHAELYSNQQGIEVHVHRKPPVKGGCTSVVRLRYLFC
jgi:hypothetical protein